MRELTITNRIRELRFAAGELSQQALADTVGVTRQTIIALEKGQYYPSLELAFRIAMAFGKSIDDVFAVATNKKAKREENGS